MAIEFDDSLGQRLVDAEVRREDDAEGSLRPQRLDDYIGQE